MSTAATNLTAAGGALRALRERTGLHQYEVARNAGISVTYLRLLENGLIPTRGMALERVFAVLLAEPVNDVDPAQPGEVDEKGHHDAPRPAG